MNASRVIDAVIDDAAGEPTIPEMQQETGRFALPVEMSGPVTVQPLPAQDATAITRTLAEAVPQNLIGFDLRRSKLTLVSTAGAFWFGFDSGSVLNKSAGLWPANVPLVITANRELWVMEDTASAVVTVLSEFWTN